MLDRLIKIVKWFDSLTTIKRNAILVLLVFVPYFGFAIIDKIIVGLVWVAVMCLIALLFEFIRYIQK